MGRFAAGEAAKADGIVADALVRIGAEIEALAVPRLAGVVLGGGYGRGEGGVFVDADGGERLSNDLDFFAVTEEGASGADIAAISAALGPVAERWTEALGVDVDFTVRTPWRIRHDEERVMIQELVHGYADVAGAKGETLFAGVERREPSAFPWTEAARLMMNRGMGLMLAREEGASPGFAARNINKCVLGAGDARLIARGGYRWRAEDRAAALGDRLYSAAVAWKFRPRPEPVCDWETAREAWLAALGETGVDGSRTLFSALRWLARRRTVGDWRTFGMDPVARILRRLEGCVRGRRPPDGALKADWRVFN